MIAAYLPKIISDPNLHARWLNTLSYLENCGAKLIAGCEHPTMVPKEVLKHAAEEFRHAYYLKAQIEKISAQACKTYQIQELLGGFAAKHYLYRLNTQISLYLKRKRKIKGERLKEYAYLLVTYAIEVRAEELYPLYQASLKAAHSPLSILSIIREEAHHLKEITEELEATEAIAWIHDVCQLEKVLFEKWQKHLFD
jgi:hypothetical protein